MDFAVKCRNAAVIAVAILGGIPTAQAESAEGHGPAVNASLIAAWDRNGDDAVTFEEVKEGRKDRFLSFDATEDGYIDSDEIAYMQDMHKTQHGGKTGPQGWNAGPSLAKLDENGDGKVSYGEFVGIAAFWFESRDKNGDAVIDALDFTAGL